MGRPPSDPPPDYTLADAIHAAEQIHRLRLKGLDRDLDFFPAPVQNDDDIDQVLLYCARHQHVAIGVLRAELLHRAVLATYVRQRDAAVHDRHDLAILETGEYTHTPSRVYGKAMGLPTRPAVSNRRKRLRDKYRNPYESEPATRRDRERTDRVDTWLRANSSELLAVAEELADYRDSLLDLVDQSRRAELADAIDEAGKTLSSRPTKSLAGAVAYAAYFLDPDTTSAHRELRELITRAHHLRRGFDAARTRA